MPRLDGIEAARRIRAGTGKSRNARIIAVTAHAMPEELDRFREAGIDDCLIKPVTRSSLARAMSVGPLSASSPMSASGPTSQFPMSAKGMASRPLIDDQQLSDLFGRLSDATANDLLRRFILEGDQIIAALTSCPPAPDRHRLCHRLAGSACNLRRTAPFGTSPDDGRKPDDRKRDLGAARSAHRNLARHPRRPRRRPADLRDRGLGPVRQNRTPAFSQDRRETGKPWPVWHLHLRETGCGDNQGEPCWRVPARCPGNQKARPVRISL